EPVQSRPIPAPASAPAGTLAFCRTSTRDATTSNTTTPAMRAPTMICPVRATLSIASWSPAVDIAEAPPPRSAATGPAFEKTAVPRGSRVFRRCFAPGWSSPARHGLDISRGQGLSSNAPTPALDLFEDHPGDLTHRLALDGNHHVGEPANHLLLLGIREDTFDHLDMDQWHGQLSALSRDSPDES